MTATQETSDYVVYRVTDGKLNAIPRLRMNGYLRDHQEVWDRVVVEVVAMGLTQEEAEYFVSLTKET